MSASTASTAVIKSFALGYKATHAVADAASTTVAATKEAKAVTTSFFAGVKFAIDELRAKDEAPVTPEAVDAKRVEEWNRTLDLFKRAHPEA